MELIFNLDGYSTLMFSKKEKLLSERKFPGTGVFRYGKIFLIFDKVALYTRLV